MNGYLWYTHMRIHTNMKHFKTSTRIEVKKNDNRENTYSGLMQLF